MMSQAQATKSARMSTLNAPFTILILTHYVAHRADWFEH